MIKILFFVFLLKFSNSQNQAFLIWHSAGESHNGNEVNNWITLLKSQFGENVYIKSAKMAADNNIDRIASLATHPFKQIEKVCSEIQMDSNLQNGYHIIGLSQGGVLG
jgi:hypothetical protein